jgi:predicted nuclease with TOPRIM domain
MEAQSQRDREQAAKLDSDNERLKREQKILEELLVNQAETMFMLKDRIDSLEQHVHRMKNFTLTEFNQPLK